MPQRLNPLDYPSCLQRPGYVPTSAWLEHGPFAGFLVEALRPRLLVELGTHFGFSYGVFCQTIQNLQLPTRCFAVDTWTGDPQTGFYGPEVLAGFRQFHDPHFAAFSTLLPTTFDAARDGFADASIDLLHIDGLHTYDAVRHDFENYLPKMSPRGVILFHDTAVRERPDFGVARLWDELRRRYPHFEFFHGHGLGVLAVGPDIPEPLLPLFAAPAEECRRIQNFFAELGGHIQAHAAVQDACTESLERFDDFRRQTASAAQRRALSHGLQPRSPRSVQTHDLGELVAVHHLDPGPEAGQWIARDTDPYFILPCALKPGWLHIQLHVTAAPGPAEVRLYFDHGQGIHLAQGIILGNLLTGTCLAERYIRVTRPIMGIRLKPSDVRGPLALHSFRVELLARWRFAGRALRDYWRRSAAEGNLIRAIRKGLVLLLTRGIPAFRAKILSKFGQGGGEPRDYDAWMRRQAITPQRRAELRAQAAALPHPPMISVLLTVQDTPEYFLRRALDSVGAQIYPHWELCIADAASAAPWVKTTLAEYARRDPRLKIASQPGDGGISAGSNGALALATGSHVALLEPEDELAEHALLAMAREIAADPALDLLYSDEDKLHAPGARSDPFFKPDWSPEFLLAGNYIGHLAVLRTALVRQIGGFRGVCDGAQDFDLILRATHHTTHIKHIPDILYHRRMIPGSTTVNLPANPRVDAAGALALREALAARGLPAAVEPGPLPATYRVRFTVQDSPRVSILIASAYRPVQGPQATPTHVENCIQSIVEKSTYRNFEIIVLDRHQMPAGLEAKLARWHVRRITYDFSFNWSAVNNLGAARATGAHLLFLNDDTQVLTPGWLEALLEFSSRRDIGAVGARLLFPAQRLQHVGIVIPRGNPTHACSGHPQSDAGYLGAAVLHRNVSAVTGACLMTRADVFESVGRFSEDFPINYNDVDYCLKVLAAGKRIVYTPYAELLHYESVSRQPTVADEEIRRFRARWGHWVDPYYNPNFSPDFNDYRLAAT